MKTTDNLRRSVKSLTLSRRACLRGLGVGMALPWLEAMGGSTRKASAAGPKPLRFLVVTAPHGMHMPAFTPKQVGADYVLPPILEPLAALKSDFNVISGLANYPASITTKEFAGSHARGTGALLTQSPLRFTAAKDIQNGISIDQVIANELKQYTRLPSLEVGVSSGSATGNCEDGYSCAYLHNISWSGPTTPMKKLTSPRQVFDRLFTGFVPPAAPTPGRPDQTAFYERTILDRVGERAAALKKKLGKSDDQKLDEYFTMVRSVEQRLAQQVMPPPAGGGAPPRCEKPAAAPAETGLSYQQHIELMCDLAVLAFKCDLTRVVTYMIEDALNTPARFGFMGISTGHHSLSHHGRNAAKLAQIAQIDAWQVARFAYLIGKLKEATEGERSILDDSVVLLTSDFGDGDDHYHWDLPMVVAGKAGGRFRTNQHVVYRHVGGGGKSTTATGDTPMANLYLNILHAFGIDMATFGTDGTAPYGTKPLAELSV